MNALKTKIQTHKILFIAITIATLVAVGVGAFFTVKAVAFEDEGFANFTIRCNGTSEFNRSTVYFVNSDGEVYESEFDQSNTAGFRHAKLGKNDYHKTANGETIEPFVCGGLCSVADGKQYMIAPKFISRNNSNAGKNLIYVTRAETLSVSLKSNCPDLRFRYYDSGSKQWTDIKNITVAKGSSVKFEKIDGQPNKLRVNVGFNDKFVYSLELISDLYSIDSIPYDSLKNIQVNQEVNIQCSKLCTPLQADGYNYLPVFSESADKHNYKFYTKVNNNIEALPDTVKMNDLAPYAGNLYVGTDNEPCIAVRSINYICYNDVFLGGRDAVLDNIPRKYPLVDAEFAEPLVDQNGQRQTPPIINGVSLTDIWKIYNPKIDRNGFGSSDGKFWSCEVYHYKNNAWYWNSFLGGWTSRDRDADSNVCVCVSRVFR